MVTALIEHTKRTYQRRVEKKPCQLLLSFIKPYVKVSSLTGIYIFIFKDHLTRAVSFSHASVADLSLDDILARDTGPIAINGRDLIKRKLCISISSKTRFLSTWISALKRRWICTLNTG